MGYTPHVDEKPPDGTGRTARQVLESHLTYRQAGDLEGDLATNYASDVILLSAEGVNHGHDGVRRLADILCSYLPEGAYRYEQILVEGQIGMLAWIGRAGRIEVHDGADSYVVRDGRIVAQTIHYSSWKR